MTRRFDFGEKQIDCENAVESAVGTMACPRCGPQSGSVYIAMRMERFDPATRAMHGSYTADQARDLAMALLIAADEIEAAAKGADAADTAARCLH